MQVTQSRTTDDAVGDHRFKVKCGSREQAHKSIVLCSMLAQFAQYSRDSDMIYEPL
jgi:hypothetical protein